MKSRFSNLFVVVLGLLSLVSTDAMAQQIGGIGVVLTVSGDGYKVVQVVPGSSAAISGQVHPGDRIISVAQGDDSPVNTTGMKLAQLVDLIRGPEDSFVRLIVVPAGKTEADAMEVRLKRCVIKVPTLPLGGGRREIVPRRERSFWTSKHISWSTIVLIVAVPIVLIFGYHRMMRK